MAPVEGLPVGPQPRLLFVHAHPDDESITTGATMAYYARLGVPVHLVTCTRGEQGEVIGSTHAHLFGDHDGLAAHRETELAAALRELGVSGHEFLGAAIGLRYRDSGMAWGPDGRATTAPDTPVDAFAVADPDGAARLLAEVIGRFRPSVLVTYDPGGGYGHPDHIRAHDVVVRALDLLAVRPVLAWVLPTPPGHAELRATHVVRGPVQAKAAALRAHATQVTVSQDERQFALSNGIWQPLTGDEYYVVTAGVTVGRAG